MRRYLKFLMCVLMLFVTICGRVSAVVTDSISVGEKSDGKQIWGTTFCLDRMVKDVMVADGRMIVMACDTTKKGKMTETGCVSTYSEKERKLLWSRKVNPLTTNLFRTSGKGVFLSTMVQKKYLLMYLDAETGKTIWSQNLCPLYINDTLNVIIGTDAPKSDKVIAFNISDGEYRWTAKVSANGNFGWDNAALIDSDRLLVLADDINMINLRTGKMDKIEAKTYVTDTKGALMSTSTLVLGSFVGCFAASALSGFSTMYVPIWQQYPTSASDAYQKLLEAHSPKNEFTIHHITSNVLLDGDRFFVSDRERLRCIDKSTMQVVWEREFPSKLASKAQLVKREGKIIMLNLGYGISSLRGIVKCGRPFLAVYDAATGEAGEITQLSDKKQVMDDGVLTDEGVYLASGDKVAYLSLTDRKVVSKEFDVKKEHRLNNVLSGGVGYVAHSDDRLLKQLPHPSDSCAIMDATGGIMIFNSNLDVVDSYAGNEVYNEIGRWNDIVLVVRHDEGLNRFFLVKKDGTYLANLKWQPKAATIVPGDSHVVVVYKDRIAMASLDGIN